MNRVGDRRQGRERLARLVPARDARRLRADLADARGERTRAATWRAHAAALQSVARARGVGWRLVPARLLRRRHAARLGRQRGMPDRLHRAVLGGDLRRRRPGARQQYLRVKDAKKKKKKKKKKNGIAPIDHAHAAPANLADQSEVAQLALQLLAAARRALGHGVVKQLEAAQVAAEAVGHVGDGPTVRRARSAGLVPVLAGIRPGSAPGVRRPPVRADGDVVIGDASRSALRYMHAASHRPQPQHPRGPDRTVDAAASSSHSPSTFRRTSTSLECAGTRGDRPVPRILRAAAPPLGDWPAAAAITAGGPRSSPRPPPTSPARPRGGCPAWPRANSARRSGPASAMIICRSHASSSRSDSPRNWTKCRWCF